MGHPEYDRVTLDVSINVDVSKNLPIEIPENYYKDNNPENRPLLMWRAHANNLYTNWLNYYVYQSTPFDLYGHRISARSKGFAEFTILRILPYFYMISRKNGVKNEVKHVRKWCQN